MKYKSGDVSGDDTVDEVCPNSEKIERYERQRKLGGPA